MTVDVLDAVDAPRARPIAITDGVRVSGKFLLSGSEKLYVKGVTYGTFGRGPHGFQFPERTRVRSDFDCMAGHGFNAVRIYTPPPPWLLDDAARAGLRVMVGLTWNQYVAFLDAARARRSIERDVRRQVADVAGHPAMLCYALANEIPASIVRWYGARTIERFLGWLYDVVKDADGKTLVTYVNYPTTEYLDLPFLDLFCFNVYLEERARLDAYLARLQNLAGERPLLLAEVGLDSRKNGEHRQAETLSWQIAAGFAAGCAGLFSFAWTDEWNVAGYDVDDWDFGLVRRDRTPKPALAAVQRAFDAAPFPKDVPWPRVSVVVCTYNGRRTLRDTLEALAHLDYPDYEVILVSDGSSDGCVALAYGYGVRIVAGPNRGLSEARNIGFRAATGDIVAYIDDDAYPDPHWLQYLAHAFATSGHAAVGGPNLAPAQSGWIADCVANAPGGATHVLLTDDTAEHIPGCNMAYRRECLEALDGFDAQFRIAGDDVDLCWRVLDRGWTIGFAPAAMVWHHRRNSFRAYWKQQKNYGKAEAMLERKWPVRFSAAGHAAWQGRVYGKGHTAGVNTWRSRIYHGVWGGAPFQSLYQPAASTVEHLPQMPEWYLVNAALVALTLCGLFWRPLFAALPLLIVTAGVPLAQAVASAAGAESPTPGIGRVATLRLRAVTAVLHMLQPMARLLGRLSHGLSPWRVRVANGLAWPVTRRRAFWSESWQAHDQRIDAFVRALTERDARFTIGGPFDRSDVIVRGGLLGTVRVLAAIEDHAPGRQLIRLRLTPRASWTSGVIAAVFVVLALLAWRDGAVGGAATLGVFGLALVARVLVEQAAAMGTALRAATTLAETHALTVIPVRGAESKVASALHV
jgi:GT2 family glycosyltransferase